MIPGPAGWGAPVATGGPATPDDGPGPAHTGDPLIPPKEPLRSAVDLV